MRVLRSSLERGASSAAAWIALSELQLEGGWLGWARKGRQEQPACL